MNTPPAVAVAEIQGLYGPFTFSEKLLQKIWARREFDTAHASTADGSRVQIETPGKWNHLGGPDFKNARLRIGDAALAGDIEVHLRETDWHAHRHADDPAYANVILHVVLFPSRRNTTPGANARVIPILTLLPLLHHDLEEYAADDAIERLASHSLSNASKNLSALSLPEILATLASHAEKRWRQKIHFAAQRIKRLGWDEACHHAALEILGYSRNRAPMLAIAGRHPLENWGKFANARDAAAFAEDIFNEHAGTWARQAARPANHPRTRLRQYAAWTTARPAWPESLLQLQLTGCFSKNDSGADANTSSSNAAAWRRANKATALRKHIRAEICADAIGGTRLDTFICDGLLPLLAAQNPACEHALGEAWTHWFTGDMPARFASQLRALGVTGGRNAPANNGAAQGLLGFLIEEELGGAKG